MIAAPTPTNPDLNVVVMASAGTGKTWQLVTRLLRLLLTGAAPDAILAITFTHKAALEMEARLLQRLLELAKADNEGLRQLLKEADAPVDAITIAQARSLHENLLRNSRNLRITTFHAFCQEILHRFPLEADVPPGFELIENSTEYVEAAWQALLNEVALQPEGAIADELGRLLERCGEIGSLRSALFSFIEHRGDWWAFTEEVDDEVAYATSQLKELLPIDPQRDPLPTLFDHALEAALAELVELMACHPTNEHVRQLEQIAIARDTEIGHGERFRALQSALLTKEGKPRARKPSKAQAGNMGGEAEQARFLALAESLTSRVVETQDILAMHNSWELNVCWYGVATRLLSHYQRIKNEQRLLDFTDLEWRAYRLLTHGDNAHWVQYKLDQRIDHLLVDEFQDTNPTQWRMLLPLLQEMAAGNAERKRSVFLVGDAKQSIYRFRRAEPRLFLAAQQWLEQQLDALTFPLHSSRRSSPAVVGAVNEIFTQPGLQGMLRDFTPHDTHLSALWGKVVVLPQPVGHVAEPLENFVGMRNPLLQPRIEQGEPLALLEARQIAEEIRRLVDQQTVIGNGTASRYLHYGDIMILFRTRSRVSHYERALREAAIPFIGADRGTLLESIEVSDMIAMFQTLLTPYDNLALATILRSPLFGCSSEELIQLAEKAQGTWWERLMCIEPIPASLERARSLMARWHLMAGRIPIHDLLDRIYNEGNVLARYEAAYPEHLRTRSRANLIRFLELALEVDSGRYPSLNHFLARLELLRENPLDAPDEAPGGGEQRVRLMTIHASKGLESPVVFLADSGNSEARDHATFNALVQWPASERRPTHFILVGRKAERDQVTEQLLSIENEEQQRESANLLYVALTRARQLLYISGTSPTRGELGNSWYFQIRNALDPSGEIAGDQAVIREQGTMPTDVAIFPKAKPPAPPRLAEALSSPVSDLRLARELAPSRSEGSPLEVISEGDDDGRLRGIAIHRFLQLLPQDDAPALLGRVAAELGMEPHDSTLGEWYREAVRVVNHLPFAAIFSPSKEAVVYCEVPLVYPLDDTTTVHGIIDRLIIGPEEVLLVDYKSHRAADVRSIPLLGKHYHEQLRLYAEGVRRLWPNRTIRALLLFTAPLILHEVII